MEEQVLGSLIRSGERGNREIVFEAHAILQEKDAFTNGLRMAAYEAIIESAKLGAPANRHTIDNALRAKGIPAK
ncbi:MAG: hypothetical protein KDG50_03410, partial [Chromatiales bacterium]|nr:hypothetical protein [Chromatiales bacterium]